MKQGIIYRKPEGPFGFQAWPSVCCDENGVLYAVCSGNRMAHICPFGKNLMFVSRDGGETWSPPIIINDTWLDDRDAGITYLGNGKMIISYFCHPKDYYLNKFNMNNWFNRNCSPIFRSMAEAAVEAYRDFTPEMNNHGSFIRISEDYGVTWGDPIMVPITAPHGPVKTPSGRLLYVGNVFGHDASREKSATPIHLYESFDDGRTWEKISEIPLPDKSTYDQVFEPHIAELADGTLVSALRVHYNPDAPDLSTFFTTSKDGGKTWSLPHPLGIEGIPPHLIPLSDGGLLCAVGKRIEPFSIWGFISYDGFETISKKICLSNITARHGGVDLGYPASVQLKDGSIVTVYYQQYGDDRQPSILYTRWRTEEAE